MKKIIYSLLILATILPQITFASFDFKPATLTNGVDKQKVVTQRQANILFKKGYKLFTANKKVGAVVSTGYKAKITASITAGATSIQVSSINDINGLALPLTALNKGYFNIEPGGSRQEQIVCTGVSAGQLTGCTRGLVATGNSETSSTTLALAHNAGSTIILTNISQFFNSYIDTTNNQTVSGIKTFNSFPLIATSTTLPTTDGQFATKKYVDTVGAGGFTSANASSTQGLQVFGTSPETVGVKASSTGGIGISSTGIYIKASSTSGLKTDVNGLAVDGTQSFTFSGTTTFSGNNSFTGSTTISKTPATTTDAVNKSYTDGLTYLSVKTGVNTVNTAATSTQTIAHGLGKTPKFLRINAFSTIGKPGPSLGTYNGTTVSSIYDGYNGGGADTINNDSTYIVNLVNSVGNGVRATVTMDATNIVLTWVFGSGGSGTAGTGYFTWEVY